ncbi:MAG: DegT/DnrJ/EryC1/StrS family aminotransferase [Rhodospirillales bacterium]
MDFIPIANPRVGEDEARAVYDVVRSGWISMGKKVQAFEDMATGYTGAKHAIAMNNGTSTLHALLIALDIGPGDEVILPTLTYISSSNVVLYQGATPVLCESDPATFNVTPEQIREKITPRTKAFMTVDLKGLPVDFDAFNALSEETGIPFISDSAESYGAVYKGQRVGAQALAHSFSFFANKNITTGEGGMVTTNDTALYEKLLIIRNQGQEGRYNHTHLGHNYRMTDVLAAIGIEQLKKIDDLLDTKVEIAATYSAAFAAIDGVTAPLVPDYVDRPSWYMYAITVDANKRDSLLEFLAGRQIDTRLSFPPVHVQPYYVDRFGYRRNDFPLAMQAFDSFVDIPIWADMGDDNQNRVIDSIRAFFTGAADAA